MSVYFAQGVDGGAIKIGTSRNVPARLRQLESNYARPLVLLGTLPGGRSEEQAIHERFAHLRLGRTEQFRPEADLMKFIGRPLFVSAAPVVEPMADASGQKPLVVQMRGSREWKVWLEGLAARERLSVANLIDRILTQYAKEIGFRPPPRR